MDLFTDFNNRYLLIPLIGALIGWGTNWLAIKMLFHPRTKRGVGPMKVQGVIPARRTELSIQVAEVIQKELINEEDLALTLEQLNIKELACAKAETMVKEKLMTSKLTGITPISNIQSILVRPVQKVVVSEVGKAVDSMQSDIISDFKDKLDLVELIETKINDFSDERMEELVFDVAARELGMIVKLGLVLGLIIGIFQMLFVLTIA